MADLAVLGLSVETGEVVKATSDLDKLAGSAAKAEKATDGVGAASERAGQRMGNGSKAVERLLQAIEKVERAVRDQNAAMGQMGGAMARAEAQMEAASNAAQSVASAVTQASTASSAASAGIAKAGAAAQAANQNFEGMNRAATAAAATLQRVNSSTGVSLPMAGAERAEDIAAYGRALDELRAKYNPLAAIGQQYAKSVAEIREAHRMGAISASEMKDAIANAGDVATAQQTALVALRERLGDVQGAARLTGNQMLNLSRQTNDALTMWFSGSGIGQIIATQAGQIYGALEEGPRGVRGSLEAIGTSLLALMTPLNLAIAGFAALGAGAIYFGMRSREKVVPLTDAMKAHKDAVGAVADAYGAAATEAANFQRSASGVAAFNLRQSRAQLELSARASLRESFQAGFFSDLTGNSVYQQGLGDNGRVITEVARQYAAFEAPVLRLVEGLEKGTARADLFVDEIAKIANLDPANEELQKAAKRLLDMAGAAADAQRQLQGLGTAFSRFATQTKQFNDLAGGLGEFIPNRLTSEQQIEQTYQQMMRLARTEADITRAQDLRRLSLEGLAEVETRRRAGYDLDVRSITARSAIERAQIEFERTYADVLTSTNDKEQAARQAEEARNLSLKQSNFDAIEAMNERIRAGQEQVGQLQLEIDTFGKSAGEVARLRAETDMLTAAREAARQAGGIVDPTEEQAIRDQAAAIGELTDRMTRLNLERDQAEAMQELRDEASVMHLNADARRVVLAGLEAERELRREGIDVNGAWGASYVQNARDMASFEGALDKQRDSFEALRDAVGGFFEALGSGEGVLDALAGAFGRFGQQLAQKGFDTLFGSLFGDGGQGASGIAQIGGAVVRAANQNVPVYGANRPVDQTFAAPLGRVERSVLPAISRTSERFAANSNDLAANIRLSADTLGVAARDIATVISFETGGTFDPWQKGPTTKWGQHRGLIQWGEPQRAQYGVTQLSTIADQMKSVTKYLFDAGVRPGMGLLDIYSAVNAGRVGRYNASDAAAGGTWGSVRDKVTYQMGPHATKADALLGVSTREYQRATASGVKTGVIDANRSMSSGSDPWSNMREAGTTPAGWLSPRMGAGLQVAGAGAGAFFGGYSSGSPLGGLLSGGLGGFQAAGSIATAFPALAGVAGPLGLAGGAILGLVGGFLGKRREREQKHQEAAQRWESVRPAYEAFDASLTDKGVGGLRTYLTEQWGKLSEFMKVGGAAWKMGSGNSTAQFRSTGQKLFDGFNKMLAEFREGYESLVADLASGQGLQGAFARGRAATRDLKKQIQATRDDVDIAFGNVADIAGMGSPEAMRQAEETEAARANAIERYNRAAGEYALSLLYQGNAVSEVVQTLEGFKGTAAGLHDVFKDLGWGADEAAAAIHDRLNRALAGVAQGLNESIRDRIEGLAGVGYFSDVRAFLEEFATLEKDVAAAGADPSGLSDLFRRQLQAIVDGAELTGTAFTDLIAQFPALAGVVREFTETAVAASATEIRDAIKGYEERLFAAQHVGDEIALFDRRAAQERLDAARFGADGLAALEKVLGAERANIARTQAQSFASGRMEQAIRARTDAESALRQEYERTVSFVDGIKGFLDSIRLNRDVSTLNNAERLAEAEKQYRETLALANGGDREAQDRLVSSSEAYLREARDYYATSEAYGKIYDEINASLKDTVAKAETELDVARRQASFLGEIATGQKGLTTLLGEYMAAVQEVMKSLALVNQNRDWGANASFNKTLVDALSKAGIIYGGNFGNGQYQSWLNTLSAADRAKAEGIGAGLSGYRPVTAPTTATRDWGVNVAANQGYVNSLASVGLSYGGAFGSGGFQSWLGGLSASDRALAGSVLGFQNGGVIPGGRVGNGSWNVDSVLARYQGGGEIALAGGEGILNARAMQVPGVADFMHAANRNVRLPEVAMPRPFSSSNDNGASVVAAIERLSARVEAVAKAQTSAVLTSGKGTQDAIRETGESNTRRNRANDRMAERRAQVASKAA